jgi:protein-S-isoprenylcysteine O-methyltransferase Ste14
LRKLFKKRAPYPVSIASAGLVILQMLALFYLAISAPLLARKLGYLLWELAGILIVISGLIGLNWKSFSVFPEPRPDGKLVTTGIYAFIRHPMYAGLLAITSVLVLDYPSWPRALALLILTIVFLIKIQKEERWLAIQYSESKDWRNKTDRLIPFLW